MGAPGEITNQESPSQAPHHNPQHLLADLWVGNNLAWSPAPVIFHNIQGSFKFQSPCWLGGAIGRALAQGFPMVHCLGCCAITGSLRVMVVTGSQRPASSF